MYPSDLTKQVLETSRAALSGRAALLIQEGVPEFPAATIAAPPSPEVAKARRQLSKIPKNNSKPAQSLMFSAGRKLHLLS